MDPCVTLTSPSRRSFSVCLLLGMNQGKRRRTKAGRTEDNAAQTQRFANCADSSCQITTQSVSAAHPASAQ